MRNHFEIEIDGKVVMTGSSASELRAWAANNTDLYWEIFGYAGAKEPDYKPDPDPKKPRPVRKNILIPEETKEEILNAFYGNEPMKSIAARYGVAVSSVWRIAEKDSYYH